MNYLHNIQYSNNNKILYYGKINYSSYRKKITGNAFSIVIERYFFLISH